MKNRTIEDEKPKPLKESDLIFSKKKSGTWMHRILAIKFAAWLNPDFEVWIYNTIDGLMFATARQIEETNQQRAKIRVEMERLRLELLDLDKFRRYELLQVKDKQFVISMGKVNRSQLSIFTEKEKESSQRR